MLVLIMMGLIGWGSASNMPQHDPGDSRQCTATLDLHVDWQLQLSVKSVLQTSYPVPLRYSDMLWGVSHSGIFQMNTTGNIYEVSQFYTEQLETDGGTVSTVLAFDGTFYVALRASIHAYNNEIPFDPFSLITKTGEYFNPDLKQGEYIVDLTLMEDPIDLAVIIIVTSHGRVGALSLDFTVATEWLHLPGIDSTTYPEYFITNSIACDNRQGGIFVVTSSSVSRVQWEQNTMTLSLSWTSPLAGVTVGQNEGEKGEEWWWGRRGPGVGSPPVLMGPNADAPQYVVISNASHVLFLDAGTGGVVSSRPIRFGGMASDVPVVVHGYRALVTRGYSEENIQPLCTQWMANAEVVSGQRKRECPFVFGDYANGLELFEIDPTTLTVQSVWFNPDVSCSTSTPVLSTLTSDDSTPVVFCMGRRRALVEKDSFVFTLEVIDWTTGASLFYIPLGSSSSYNSLFPDMEVTTSDSTDIVLSTLGGLLHISHINCQSDEAKEMVRRAGSLSLVAPHPSVTDPLSRRQKYLLFSSETPAIEVLDRLTTLYHSGSVPSAQFLAGIDI